MTTPSKNALCLLCGNVWLLSLQPVCEACGCGSFQVVDTNAGTDFHASAAVAWELHRPLVTIAGRHIVRAA